MTASLSGIFSLQEFTDLGSPLVGGRVYTYTQGTTTHKTAYTDKAGSIAHTYTSDGIGGQYIALNARGELPAPLYLAAGSYDIALKDAGGATIWTRRADPVDDSAAALDAAIRADLASTSDAAKGAALVGLYGTSRTAQDKFDDWVSVKDKGAKGDGSTDDAAGLQAAMNFAASNNLELVAPGKGTYLIGSGLSIPSGLRADFKGSTIKRKSGSVFNMLENTSGTGIKLQNLVVDGNKAADGRVAANVGDRFGGIVLNSVTSSELRNVTVNNTVNAEDGRAGVYLGACTNVDLYNVGGSGNDRSCVFLDGSTFIRIFGSYTANNLGSGVTSDDSNDCEYYAITAINSGYSGISINGLRSKANGLRAIGTATGYAGVNIGHDDASNRSHDSVIENVHSYSNSGWGVTVVGSDRVQLRGIYAGANASANVYVFSNSNACSIDGLTASGSTAGSGVLITSGTGHKIDNAEAHTNALHGIDVETGCGAVISSTVRSYNNGQTTGGMAGVLLNGAVGSSCYAECFDDQGSKTQGYGIWLAGGTSNMIGGYYHDNATSPVLETSSPSYSSDRIRTGANILNGSFTPAAAATSVTINNNNARSGMTVVFQPANAAGRTLGLPILSTITAGASFVANLGGAAAGTESYTYTIL